MRYTASEIESRLYEGLSKDAEFVAASDYDALASELARVKAESLRVVLDGNPVEYGHWWTQYGYGATIRLSTGEICIEVAGDCVAEVGKSSELDELIDIDDIDVVQPVRLERWEDAK